MSLKSRIEWYAKGAFTSADLKRSTGLSERSQRELLKFGILQAIPQSRTATRLFGSRMLKRGALIYPFNEFGGLNLRVSGKLVYADIILESLLYDVVDPWQAYHHMLEKAPQGENEWSWFTSRDSRTAYSSDYYISLIDGHYVASGQGDSHRIFGHLTEDRSDIVVYYGAVYDELIKPSLRNFENSLPNEFHPESALVDDSRIFRSETPSKIDQAAAKRAVRGPISKFSINASLTLRVAMRRLLKIDRELS
jgi:hypothetical protein